MGRNKHHFICRQCCVVNKISPNSDSIHHQLYKHVIIIIATPAQQLLNTLQGLLQSVCSKNFSFSFSAFLTSNVLSLYGSQMWNSGMQRCVFCVIDTSQDVKQSCSYIMQTLIRTERHYQQESYQFTSSFKYKFLSIIVASQPHPFSSLQTQETQE